MNDQHLLFLRTGLTPRAIQLLSTHIEGGSTPTIRTCQRWFNGEQVPKNGLVSYAQEIDITMSNYAMQLIMDADERIDIITFNDDDELWANHPNMIPLSVSVHNALVNRIVIFAPAKLLHTRTIGASGEPTTQSWDNIVNVSIDVHALLRDADNQLSH